MDPQLEYADYVTKMFEWKRKDNRMDTVTQMASGDRLLCPVRLDAVLVRRMRGYPGSSDNTPMSVVWRNDRIEHITSNEMVEALRAAVGALGEEKLGILMKEVGTHSIWLGAAMAMYLGECPLYTILVIGSWSSDASLRYIRKQIKQFSHNVSCNMLKFETHRRILDPQRISHIDPRQRNHKDNVKTRNNVGGDLSRRIQLPVFLLFN